MIAFRYDATGTLTHCADMGPEFREPVRQPRSLAPLPPRTKRERRRFARKGRRGRRSAVRVGPVVSQREQLRSAIPALIVYRGHALRDGNGVEALLYLAEGVECSDADRARVDRAMVTSRDDNKARLLPQSATASPWLR